MNAWAGEIKSGVRYMLHGPVGLKKAKPVCFKKDGLWKKVSVYIYTARFRIFSEQQTRLIERGAQKSAGFHCKAERVEFCSF